MGVERATGGRKNTCKHGGKRLLGIVGAWMMDDGGNGERRGWRNQEGTIHKGLSRLTRGLGFISPMGTETPVGSFKMRK